MNENETTPPSITAPKDIQDALDTIKSVEIMGYALDDVAFKLKWAKGIFHCMDILRKIHDDLVQRLPPEIIAAEQQKAKPQPIKPEVA